MVARLHPGDALAHGFHDPGALVPGDDRRRHHRAGAGQHVGVAHAGADDTDADLSVTGVGQLHVLDGVRACRVAQHCGLDLH